MTEHAVRKALRQRWEAYEQLAGAAHSLQDSPLFWTERALLRLVEALAWRRLEQLGAISGFTGDGRGPFIDEGDLGDKG